MAKQRAKPRGKPFQQGYDERRNLLGAPTRGESYAEHFDKAVQMTPEQVVQLIGVNNDLGQAFAQMPADVPLKMLLALRNIAAEMFEPSSSRLGMIMDRTEGKVTDHLDLTSKGNSLQPEEMKPSEIAARVAALLKGTNDTNGS